MARFIHRIAPTLFELGAWIFGSLIAFNLLVLASLFTIGPAANSIQVAAAAFALALPLDLVGLFLLRMIQGLKNTGLEDKLAQAFQEQGLVSDQFPAPPDIEATLEAMRKRRAEIVMRWSSVILALSFLLTLTGLVATLWYMAWWIAVSFIIMVVLSLSIVILVLIASQPDEASQ